MSSVRIGARMAFFRGFGPRRAAVWAEQPFFSFAIIFYHPKEHSLRVSAFNSKFLSFTLLGSTFCVVKHRITLRKKRWPLRKFSSWELKLAQNVHWDARWRLQKKKFGRSDKPAAWRGPKPLKIAIFEAIRKKRKIEKIASKLVGITRRKN